MIAIPSITQIKDQFTVTFKRFPLPVTGAGVMTLLGILLVHDMLGSNTEDWVAKGLLTAMLGTLWFTVINLATENVSVKIKNGAILGGALLLALYFFTLPGDVNDAGSLWIIRHIFLMLAGSVALTWIPYWQGKPDDNKVLWRWCADLIGNFMVTGFFALVLFLGTCAAIWSVDALFGVNIDEELYFDVWIVAAAWFSPIFFLSQFAPKPLELSLPGKVNTFISIFTKYIMSPIAAVYLVILYTYTAKILITWEWPKNVLGWLVICFLGVAIFTYFLWTPLLKSGFEKYRRIFWLLLIPQIVLLYIAIGWRIHAYSWTENRYFVVVLGLWLLGVTVYFLINAKAKFKWAFVALTAIILISQIGPLSGYQVGLRAQTSRLDAYLTELGVKQSDGSYQKINFEANRELEDEVASILDYIEDRHGRAKIESLFPESFAQLDNDPDGYAYKYLRVEKLMESWGLKYRNAWERRSDRYDDSLYFSYGLDGLAPKDISGYEWDVPVLYYQTNQEKKTPLPFRLERSKHGEPPAILVWEDETLVETIELAPVLQAIVDAHPADTYTQLSPEQMRYDFTSDRFDLRLYFTSISGDKEGVSSFDAQAFMRISQ